ncbi:MAG: glycosyltransferase [Chromatiales bacterium]|jgi:exo-beta-1,3-glucanase (GH17 family)/cellulose synthase/poly-beta-1,6-N-acetylglucosamine synthase-like glycosyltransferase
MSRANIIIALVIAALTISFWALLNRPEVEPPWPEVIQGFSFSPMGIQHDPAKGILPTAEEIDADLALLQGRTHAVRTYTVEGAQGEIPRLARKYGINVALGAWIDERLKKNEAEIDRVIEIAGENRRNVVRVIVGNEVILRKDIPPKQLIEYLDKVRKALGVPVSTAEPWHIWLKYPNLADHVDYLAIHMLPYWEGVPLDKAVDYIVERVNQLKERFPNKPIVIAEVGWPSNGRTRQGAVASLANQAVFLRRFIDRARQERYIYYVMEAFDQLWKAKNEGSVGSYWGVYNVEREPKFTFKEPIVEIPQWHTLAGISVLIAAITFSLLLIDSKTLTHRGRGFLAIIAYVAATAAVWIVYSYIQQYLSISSIIVGILMLLGMIGVIIVLLVEAHEWAEALWVKSRRRGFTPVSIVEDELPMVSIHLPAYNEPPDMLIETLDALTRLDYPNFEVLVIDNNTEDPAVWGPVEKHCQTLGKRFRFFHVAPLAGFKSGALNYALRQTSPEAQIVAVIDSDYQVHPDWLKDLTPQFQNPKIAVVQAPQDYRDAGENAFKAMCYAEYRGFFYIGMVTRNERNAIIQHGTMTMVRRKVLEEVGNWSEESITEDAELGLRIFEHGDEATYIAKSYGKGLIPDTFLNYKNQRFRWAYGAMTIMRSHARQLFGRACKHLSFGQRYHFIAGWLPWIADSINLIFNFAALSWSLGMILAPKAVDPPLIIFSALPLALFLFKVAKMIYLYRGINVVGTTRQTLAAALSGLALSHTIAKAMLLGAITKNKPFLRTPKLASSAALLQAINAAREETLLMIALWLSAWGIAQIHGTESMDLVLWVSVLLVQSIPYVASLLMSIISGFPNLRADLVSSTATLDRLESKAKT